MDFFSTYYMIGMLQEIVPVPTFFRDRYFPTGAGDIFAANKVLVEYQDGDRAMAPFVVPRAGDIPIARKGYMVDEFEPAYIAPSRMLTIDDLKKRLFGEAMYSTASKADRAKMLQMKDLTDLDKRIIRREEWLSAETMINNGCTIVSYIDDKTVGETSDIYFYDVNGSNPALYSVANKWDAGDSDYGIIKGDVRTMCRMLSSRGLPSADLVLGVDAGDAILANKDARELLDRNSGVAIGAIEEELSKYEGVVLLGRLNFGGFKLNLISVDETYTDESGKTKNFFPKTSAMVTAPNCGHMMYGNITQINPITKELEDFPYARVPKLVVDEDRDTRKLRLASSPLAAPVNKAPWIYASNVVG